ncbi:MAG: nucleoside-diphosphate sugar epimerase/dehydratase, partial [Syntrophales bacterium]|nr:nucleoside-diphosphate sugar epimerase/dehydratase [Syntrophales bacterium]
MWRYTGLADLVNLIKACLTSSIVLVLLILFLFQFQGFSRSVCIIDFFLSIIFLSGSRLGVRIFLSDATPSFSFWTFLPYKKTDAKKILIIGAGDTGEKVLREIINSPRINMIPVGFLDDDQSKRGKTIHGVSVLGDISQLDEIAVFFEEVIIAVPSASGSQMRQIVKNCEKAGKPCKTMPPLAEIINGKVSLKMVREVTISDLLGREEVRLDDEEIKKYLFNKRILVTGAGGSIGSELVRQICRFNPRSIALLDFSEFNLYQVEMDCRIKFGYITVISYLADIRNVSTTGRIFHEYSPEVIFHAAAYKHVPMQEMNPWEAVCNNLIGTKNIVKNAIDIKADHFIMVSSDKAVRPVNIMGATKRVCELMTSGRNENVKTKFMSVRFGNVIDSSGSVVPLFQKQVASGGPVTVTHPEIKRYFMSIPEAAQLILQAGAMGEGGEIYILEMGDPIRIADLAHEIIKLNGLEPGKDIEIVFIGLRPGEKLYEEL